MNKSDKKEDLSSKLEEKTNKKYITPTYKNIPVTNFHK